MMFLRNLVLVTLLAASATASATAGQAQATRKTCGAWLESDRRCKIERGYGPLATGMIFDDQVLNWILKGYKSEVRKCANIKGDDRTKIGECEGVTPMYCFLAYDEGHMFPRQRNLNAQETASSQMQTLATNECRRASIFGSSSQRLCKPWVLAAMDGEGATINCGDWTYKIDAYEQTPSGQQALHVASARGHQRFGTSRKTIETAKNSQQTTGSSDNTVLIVVVALLSVFALAVGVWVGRLSSEMKIPQNAQIEQAHNQTV